MEAKLAIRSEGQPIQCKAAVCRKPGDPLVMEDIVVAPPMSREVRIRIICTSLCHSDITFWRMKDPPGIVPRILGHEAVGVVESVGEDVSEFEKGDVVLPVFLPECGECIDCNSKKSNLCSKLTFKVSPWMPRHGVGAAWRTAEVEAGSTVAIFGLGSIGLAVAEGARLCGAARIIGVDVNPEKFEIGKKFGLTDFVNPGECGDKPVSQVINDITVGGADYCFECVGMASLVHEAYASCRKGWGKTIVVGVDKPGSRLSLSSGEVLHSGKSLMGSLFGGLKPKSHIPMLLKRYMDKELQLDDFVTHEVDFKDINKAFNLLLEGQCLRCVVWMDK